MVSRREFIKYSALAAAGLLLPKNASRLRGSSVMQTSTGQLGRICAGFEGAHFKLKSRPNWNASDTGTLWRDDIITWDKEVVTDSIDVNQYPQRWLQTADGYIFSPYVQKVKEVRNTPLSEIPTDPASGEKGMWIEITVPYVDMVLTRSLESYSYWVKEVVKPRLYYQGIYWAMDVRTNDEGVVQYLVMQKFGSQPDTYWVEASACRPITPEEIAPINPDAADKRIVVNLRYQRLICYEGQREVYFCLISSGGYINERWTTPVGTHTIWRKMVGTHMSQGGVVGEGFDTPGVGWTTLFDNNGAAIHAAYWHNNFGTARSHGCVNVLPDDAKWIFRWTRPAVQYYPGDIIVQGMDQSTKVQVIEN